MHRLYIFLSKFLIHLFHPMFLMHPFHPSFTTSFIIFHNMQVGRPITL